MIDGRWPLWLIGGTQRSSGASLSPATPPTKIVSAPLWWVFSPTSGDMAHPGNLSQFGNAGNTGVFGGRGRPRSLACRLLQGSQRRAAADQRPLEPPNASNRNTRMSKILIAALFGICSFAFVAAPGASISLPARSPSSRRSPRTAPTTCLAEWIRSRTPDPTREVREPQQTPRLPVPPGCSCRLESEFDRRSQTRPLRSNRSMRFPIGQLGKHGSLVQLLTF